MLGKAGPRRLIVAQVGGHKDHAIRRVVDLDEPLEAADLQQAVELVLLQPGQPHQLHHVAGVVAVSRPGHPVGLRRVRRDTEDVAEVEA